MFFKKEEWGILWPFYLDALIAPALFFYPAFMTIYFLQIGLSIFQIGTITAFYSLVTLLFEIPTGSFADIYGRKYSVILGGIISIIALSLLYVFKNYWAIFLLFGLLGFAHTFASGATEAWKVDLIKKRNKKLLNNFMMKTHSIESTGIVISGLIGAFIVHLLGTSSIWLFGAFAFFVSIVILLFAREHFVKNKMPTTTSFSKISLQTKNTVVYAYRHHVIFWLFLASFILTFVMSANSRLIWTPFLKLFNFPDYAFGYLWSLAGLVGIVAPLFSRKLLKKNNEKKLLIFIWGLYFVTMLWVILVQNIIAALMIMTIAAFLVNARWPIQRIYLHRFIPDKIRATVGSIESIVISIGFMVASVLIGYAADKIGPKMTLFWGAFLILPVIFIYLKIKEKLYPIIRQ
jgi:MFS family permease